MRLTLNRSEQRLIDLNFCQLWQPIAQNGKNDRNLPQTAILSLDPAHLNTWDLGWLPPPVTSRKNRKRWVACTSFLESYDDQQSAERPSRNIAVEYAQISQLLLAQSFCSKVLYFVW